MEKESVKREEDARNWPQWQKKTELAMIGHSKVHHNLHRSCAFPFVGFSLPNLLKELAQTSYELKSLRAMLAAEASELAEDEAGILLERLDRDWLEARERRLGAMLAELLTFSDCLGKAKVPCGFGEFTKPKNMAERNLVNSNNFQ